MDIHIGADVEATDGRVGQLTRLVVEPQDQVLMQVIVRGHGVLGVERLVPIEEVGDASPQRVALLINRAEFEQLTPFDRTVEYTPPGVGDVYIDQVRSESEITLDEQTIPEDEVAVRGGERVEATDGEIGRVDGVVIDSTTHVLSHLVLREGHLWQTRIVTIPVGHIDRVEHGVIYLALGQAEIEPMAKATDA